MGSANLKSTNLNEIQLNFFFNARLVRSVKNLKTTSDKERHEIDDTLAYCIKGDIKLCVNSERATLIQCNCFNDCLRNVSNFSPFCAQQTKPKSPLQNSTTRKMRYERMSTFYQL